MLKRGTLTKMHKWRKQDFRGAEEAEAEKDLEEVVDSWYATIAEG